MWPVGKDKWLVCFLILQVLYLLDGDLCLVDGDAVGCGEIPGSLLRSLVQNMADAHQGRHLGSGHVGHPRWRQSSLPVDLPSISGQEQMYWSPPVQGLPKRHLALDKLCPVLTDTLCRDDDL